MSASKKEEKTREHDASKADRARELFSPENGVTLWHNSESAYATMPNNGLVDLQSQEAYDITRVLFAEKYGQSIHESAVREALDMIRAFARKRGEHRDTFLRKGWYQDTLYLQCRAGYIEVNARGWKIVDTCPISFLPTTRLDYFPVPERANNDSIALLRRYVNTDDTDWPLVNAWILSCFMPIGACPTLVLLGKHGSGKSTSACSLVSLVDPRPVFEHGKMRVSRKEETTFKLAKHYNVLSYDNLSSLPAWLSDALCTLATGGSQEDRKLYSDNDLAGVVAKRPIILNGIGDIVERSDLLDRSLLIHTPEIDRYTNERQLEQDFLRDRPIVFGIILDQICNGIANLQTTIVDRPARMADFHLWSVACGVENFTEIYEDNRARASETAIEASPIGKLIIQLLDNKSSKHHITENNLQVAITQLGNRSDLLGAYFLKLETLHELGTLSASLSNKSDWPYSVIQASNALERIIPSLRIRGIHIERIHRHDTGNWIFIKRNGV